MIYINGNSSFSYQPEGIMAVYVGIKKQFEKNENGHLIHYYLVETKDSGGCHFYIGIDPDHKIVRFYPDEKLLECVKILDFNDQESGIGEIPVASNYIYTRVIIQCMRAFSTNEFPQYLDYCA
jgi:hypothetical protein